MRRIADVIKQVKSGRGPEVLILPEVENKAVIESLRQKYLSGLGYKESLLIEGPDRRGIDIAILTKLEVLASQSHRIQLEEKDGLTKGDIRPTRDIIQADLQLPDGRILTVLGVHFPSPMNPTGARIQTIRRLSEIKKALPKGRLVVAGGDFNITSREERTHRLYREKLGIEWVISHEVGCENCKGTYLLSSRHLLVFFRCHFIFQRNASRSSRSLESSDAKYSCADKKPLSNQPLRLSSQVPTGKSKNWGIRPLASSY